MKKIFLLTLIIALTGLTGGFAGAQQPKRVYRIGWIAFFGSRPPRDFTTELRQRGYSDGQNIAIEYRSAQGTENRLPEIANELVRLKPDVIVADSNAATDAAKEATKAIPIVFIHGDPVGDSTVSSLAKPENNLTGLSVVSFELAGKRLELLRDAFPKISRVAVVLEADATHRRQFADMQNVAKALGVQLQALEYQNLMLNFDSVFQRAINERANAFVVLLSPTALRHRTRLVDFAAKNRLPAIYPTRAFADAGGLMSYGVDYPEVHRRAAYFVDRILKGAKPTDLPVEQATKFELVVNLKTAKQIGLTIPSKVLMWADKVIGDGGQMPEKSVATNYPSEAQHPAKIPRIGILSAGGRGRAIGPFENGLRELGYVEGQNIAFEYRGADGNDERFPALAAELLRMNVDIIVITSVRGALAGRRLTKTTPIVTVIPGPAGSGLVDSLDRPGGNVTGLSFMRPELGGKRLELLKEIIPGVSRVAVLSNVATIQNRSIKEIESVTRSLNVQLQILNVKEPHEFENAFASMARRQVGALTVQTQGMLALNRKRIVELAAKSRLSAMYPDSRFTDVGGLVSYGPNHAELYRRAAYFVDRILKGAKPGDLPVEQPTKFELVINLKTARQLGLTIPPKALMWADKVIE